MTTIKEQKKMARELRQAFQGKPARVPRRAKSDADVWFERMKADFAQNGTEHLASAKAKMGVK